MAKNETEGSPKGAKSQEHGTKKGQQVTERNQKHGFATTNIQEKASEQQAEGKKEDRKTQPLK